MEELSNNHIHNPPIQEEHVSFYNTTHVQYSLGFPEAASVYDPSTSSLGHNLALPPQPAPLFKEFGRSGDVASASRNSGHGGKFGLFGSDGDEWEGLLGSFDKNNGVLLEFIMENNVGRFGRGNTGSTTNDRANPFATERQRRVQMSNKYITLRDLIPNPTKPDRASTVGDAIEYIKELTRTIHELNILVEKKRSCGRNQDRRTKCYKTDQDYDASRTSMTESSSDKNPVHADDQSHDHGQSLIKMFLRTSWLQRKSKDTEVDVRIIDDEVTVKLVQRRKINLLLVASKLLDQLRLEICLIAGGCVGDSYSFLFNTKIYEGSSLYASAIANKLIDVLDIQHAATSL
ncbi:hypothetical protein TIFTF001_038872 [Ficus carica]|uniref:BHLH domain-containing protein n=1 Tax=Ficus carica TaxID=3494 RepID=A0AA88JAE3_FICCA|nr:hypothetical protein TIFTF001_038872 [Ficus carica]